MISHHMGASLHPWGDLGDEKKWKTNSILRGRRGRASQQSPQRKTQGPTCKPCVACKCSWGGGKAKKLKNSMVFIAFHENSSFCLVKWQLANSTSFASRFQGTYLQATSCLQVLLEGEGQSENLKSSIVLIFL